MQVINVELEEKIPYTLSLTYRDETTNLPVDLSGYSALIQIRDGFGGPYSLSELSVGSGITLGGVTGAIDVVFPSSISDLSVQPSGWTRGVYDLVITSPSGNRIKLVKGFVTILRSATL